MINKRTYHNPTFNKIITPSGITLTHKSYSAGNIDGYDEFSSRTSLSPSLNVTSGKYYLILSNIQGWSASSRFGTSARITRGADVINYGAWNQSSAGVEIILVKATSNTIVLGDGRDWDKSRLVVAIELKI